MDHDRFMLGMLLGGALVALVPTLIVIAVVVHVVRSLRARPGSVSEVVQTREVPP